MNQSGDASMLDFGPEFSSENVQFLMNEEVLFLLSKREKQASDGPLNQKGQETLDYLRKIIPWRDMSKVRTATSEIRKTLVEAEYGTKDGYTRKLHNYEMAQLGNLVMDVGMEEIVNLIPSLSNLDDKEIGRILETVANAKKILA